jgi:hypothetical protein
MKNLICIVVFFLIFQQSTTAKEFSLKYGKVTKDELTMKIYEKDTTAAAVVLYESGNSSFDYIADKFKVREEVKRKIKILKQEGVNQATVKVQYFYKENGDKEAITNIEAYSYNLDNGNIIKTKLDNKYVFDEEINNTYRAIKFSIPNVKVGTVIEYRYIKNIESYAEIPDWNFQSEIPVINSDYEAIIPEYFVFNREIKGYEKVKAVESSQSQQFNLRATTDGPNSVTCQSHDFTYTATDIPALKTEPYVWCVNDFTSGIRFELEGTNFPNTIYKPYAQTWDILEETIKKQTDFGSNLKMSSPFKEEIKVLTDTVKSEKKKIELIYSFIKNHISWNGNYSFFGNKYKEALKNGTGDNGQINMILMSALKNAGIYTYPILISLRSHGRLPFTYPSFDKLNTFIVAAQTSNGAIFYMDGSATNGGLNMLPINILVDRGRVFEETMSNKWVDLTKAAKNQVVYIINSKFDKEGNLTGTLNSGYANQLAYSYKSNYHAAKDSMEFVEKLENSYHFKIDSMSITGKDPMSTIVKEKIKFSKKLDLQGEYVYINPMILMQIDKNPFTQSVRKLPVEFDYSFNFQLSSTLTIPENYKVEELPKSVKIVLAENAGQCIYQAIQKENKIQLNYKFEMSQSIFPQEYYTAIRDFYANVATKNAELIVLKKIN